VREFQESLRSLGYHGADQRPLSTDGNFGPNTKHAIQSFQRAHHLHVDGIVGKDTRAALKDAQHAPLLSEATNPHHHLYAKILHGMLKLPQGTYRNEQERANAAVALTISAHVQGLKDIDHVVLGKDGTNLFAVRGRMDDPAHRRVHVDHAQAMSRSMDYGTPALQVSQVRQPMHDMQAAMQATQAMHSQIEQHGPVLSISR
jgi:lysozyme family protein